MERENKLVYGAINSDNNENSKIIPGNDDYLLLLRARAAAVQGSAPFNERECKGGSDL